MSDQLLMQLAETELVKLAQDAELVTETEENKTAFIRITLAHRIKQARLLDDSALPVYLKAQLLFRQKYLVIGTARVHSAQSNKRRL